MKLFLFLLTVAVTSQALESNMFQQQAWNVEQMKEARQRRFTLTRTPTVRTRDTATSTITPGGVLTATPTLTVTATRTRSI